MLYEICWKPLHEIRSIYCWIFRNLFFILSNFRFTLLAAYMLNVPNILSTVQRIDPLKREVGPTLILVHMHCWLFVFKNLTPLKVSHFLITPGQNTQRSMRRDIHKDSAHSLPCRFKIINLLGREQSYRSGYRQKGVWIQAKKDSVPERC